MERSISPAPLRQRPQARSAGNATDWIIAAGGRLGRDDQEGWLVRGQGRAEAGSRPLTSRRVSRAEWATVALVTSVAAALRIHKLDQPSAVVFDEVHFGVFTSYYMRREYFFDVHPPLAKLLLAGAAWLAGFDGSFEFENIGDSYVDSGVPYVAMRALPAFFGTLVPPLVFATMRTSGCSILASVLSTLLILLDNAHVVQTRLIFLDGPLVFFALASIASHVQFSNTRQYEFTRAWWIWLCLTGASLGATISCKMVGLFTFLTVGSAVIIDLFSILGLRHTSWRQSNLQTARFTKHFGARVLGLIILPSIIYLSCFWVHLAILNKTGTGDDFMQIPFQRTLVGNPHLLASEEIRHFDILTLRHRDTKAFLHADPDGDKMALVSGLMNVTANNEWIVEPTHEIPPTGRGRIVRQREFITLRHRTSNLSLASIDQAASSFVRFTTLTDEEVDARPDSTRFELVIDDAHPGQQWLSKTSQFILIHDELQVAIVARRSGSKYSSTLDIAGTQNLRDDAALFTVDEVFPQPDEAGRTPARRKETPLQHMSFWRKFIELQRLMLEHNAEITDSHPYTSHPLTWPFLLKGISFWTEGTSRAQVYMIGNPVSWWLCVAGVVLFPIVSLWEWSRRRASRRTQLLFGLAEPQLFTFGLLFLAGWAFHYFPFFLMSRQLFLHHYLPAHLFSALATGSLFDFVAARARLSTRTRFTLAAVFLVALVTGFGFFSSFTYGTPMPDPATVRRRRMFKSWVIHHVV